MATLSIAPLAIPEDTIQGTGSYTIPANKYAWFCGNSYSVSSVNDACGITAAAATKDAMKEAGKMNSSFQGYLVSGDSITVTSVAQSILGNVSWGSAANYNVVSRDFYSQININGTAVSKASARVWRANSDLSGNTVPNYCSAQGEAASQWNASIYPIPKNNLPLNLQEGN